MKFSHSLQINSVPEWTTYYINYAHLKRLIYQLEKVNVKQVVPGEGSVAGPKKGYNALSGGDDTASEIVVAVQGDSTEELTHNIDGASDTSSAILRNSNDVFVVALDTELEKILAFYMKLEKSLKDRLQQLVSDIEFLEKYEDSGLFKPAKLSLEQQKNLPQSSADSSPVKPMLKPVESGSASPLSATEILLPPAPTSRRSIEQFGNAKANFRKVSRELYVQINELKDFTDLNYTGFVKILKKYDKVVGTQLREWYLSEVVNVAYPFLLESKRRVEVMIKRTVQLYAYLSGETMAASLQELNIISKTDLEIALSELSSHLREKIIWERNTIWREMVENERKTTNIGVKKALTEQAEPLTSFYFWGGKVDIPRPTKQFYIFISAVLLFVSLLVIPIFDRPEAQNCLAILALAVVFWAFEVIPLFVTSLVVPMLVVLLRVMRANDERLSAPLAAKAVFSTMFSPVIMLLLGGFTLAAALSKHHIAKSMAGLILSKAGTRPSNILLVNMAVACFASMWISNVAAPVLCFSLIQPILRTLPSQSAYGKCLILGIAMASNIGGMASPISSPQNIIALQNLKPAATWPQWLLASVPICTICIVAVWGILNAVFKPNQTTHTHPPALCPPSSIVGISEFKGSSGKSIGGVSLTVLEKRFNGTQFYVCVVCLLTIALWIAESFFEDVLGDMGVVAILPIVLFFGTGVLGKEDFNNFLWTVMVLAMGGIALGKAVDSSGLLNIITAHIVPMVSVLTIWQQFTIFAAIVGVVTTFISHTVGALIILPIVASVGNAAGGGEPYGNLLVMGCAFMCSAAMGLPVSSFPNMNAISLEDLTGKPWLTTVDFMKIGILSTAASWLVVVSAGYLLLSVIGF